MVKFYLDIVSIILQIVSIIVSIVVSVENKKKQTRPRYGVVYFLTDSLSLFELSYCPCTSGECQRTPHFYCNFIISHLFIYVKTLIKFFHVIIDIFISTWYNKYSGQQPAVCQTAIGRSAHQIFICIIELVAFSDTGATSLLFLPKSRQASKPFRDTRLF